MPNSPKQKAARRRPPRFELVAGAVCLDFVNTLDDRFSSEPKELLKHYVDLARFAEDAGILDIAQVDRLIEQSYLSPQAAQRALAAAIRMREAMNAVFVAIVNKKSVPQAALMTLNGYVQAAGQHAELVPVNGRFEWRFDGLPIDFEAPLWPIARSAADLLASDQLRFVRACASKTCLWLFLDSSKNHRRRWCDMTKCGNRAKFQRFYARQRAQQ
ncbi:MAG TPA: ABATE domain-containing protein [archaeon]|nr:ABATE domain-containing protein [archaeon]